MLFTLFRKAGATGNVFTFKNGKVRDRGLAYSGLVGPMITVAVVPTTPQVLNFAIEAQTKDKQLVKVQGSVTATLVPAIAVSRLDFTVNPKTGAYDSPWQKALNEKVLEKVLRAVLEKVRDLDVEEATRSQKEVEDQVTGALGDKAFAAEGIIITSCSVPKIEPNDDEVSDAIGAKERQQKLTEADEALHNRRIKAAGNERAIKKLEAETRLELEKDQEKLLEEKIKNQKKEAEGDAAATQIRLKALAKTAPGKILGAALIKMAEGGRIGNLAIGPELLAALAQKTTA